MSQIDFEILTNERPDLADSWLLLSRWISSHPSVRSVSLDRLARYDRNVRAGSLAEAFDVLCSRGWVREVYRVKDLDGTFLAGEYDSPRDVPQQVPDRLHESYIDVAETDVEPVYRLE